MDNELENYYESQTELPDIDDHMDLEPDEEQEPGEPSEDMDGDHATALASAGLGTDEDYFFGSLDAE